MIARAPLLLVSALAVSIITALPASKEIRDSKRGALQPNSFAGRGGGGGGRGGRGGAGGGEDESPPPPSPPAPPSPPPLPPPPSPPPFVDDCTDYTDAFQCPGFNETSVCEFNNQIYPENCVDDSISDCWLHYCKKTCSVGCSTEACTDYPDPFLCPGYDVSSVCEFNGVHYPEKCNDASIGDCWKQYCQKTCSIGCTVPACTDYPDPFLCPGFDVSSVCSYQGVTYPQNCNDPSVGDCWKEYCQATCQVGCTSTA